MGPFDLTQSPVTFALLLLNVLASYFALSLDQSIIGRFALSVSGVLRNGRYYQLVTSAFLHANAAHLLVNMLTLFFFGPVLERILGPVGYGIVYLVAAHAGNIAWLAANRHYPERRALGASGAISGIVFAFCLYAPWAEIFIFFIPFGIPAIFYAVLYTAYSMYAMQDRSAGGIAHEAHLGGALGGILATLAIDPGALPTFLTQIGLG